MLFLYVIWLLLNGALALGILFGWYRCLQLFARQYSRSTSVALCVVTLMTFGGHQEPSRTPAGTIAIAQTDLPIRHPVLYDHRLLDLPTNCLWQHIQLSPSSKPGDSVQVAHTVSLLGLQAGLRWQPISLSISPHPDRQIHYGVAGILEWRLLNTTVYR